MANIAPSVLRQASRLASKSAISAAPRRGVQALSRAATAPARGACKRCYVTQTKSDNAQVQVDTAIRLDRAELEKAGAVLDAQNGSTTHVSPMAGRLDAAYRRPTLGANF
jgi:cysteine desulfurase